MVRKNLKVFLDTSVIFAAVLSQSGGARQLFNLAEAGVLELVAGPAVLQEAEEVVRRKAQASLPLLAQLLHFGNVETVNTFKPKHLALAQSIVVYAPDARVLAEAIQAEPDWFVTHDKEHFLKAKQRIQLPFKIGTPGDLIQSIKDEYYLP